MMNASRTIICPHCGAENWPGQSACYACGGDLRASSGPGALGAGSLPTQPVRVLHSAENAGETRLGEGSPARPAAALPQAARPASAAIPQRGGSQPPLPPPGVAGGSLHDHLDPNRNWRIFAVILGLVVCCAGVFAVWLIGRVMVNGMQRAAGQVQTRIPQEMITLPVPPGSTEPSSTEAPFIPSPWPTPTTAGAEGATPAPGWRSYLTPECSAALDHLSAANQYLADHPSAPFEVDWRDDLSAAVGEVRKSCSTLESASPVPGQLREAYSDLQRATDEFDQANQLIKEGLDEFAPGKVIDAVSRYRVAMKYLGAALEQLNRVGK